MKMHLKLTNMPALRFLAAAFLLLAAAPTVFSQQIPRYSSNAAAAATVLLDFDGQVVKGTAWNWDEAIVAKPAALSSAIVTEVFNRVAEDFRIFSLNITTDSTVYKRAPATKRMRIIITPTSDWYGNSAGVSFVNSFTWGDDTPAWVFTRLLENKAKYIAEAASHEIGHTLGLQHQSTYNKSCELIAEYAAGKGSGEIGWAPIMGVGYYKNLTLWTVGTSVEGCKIVQNDISILSKGFANLGFRSDDHGNSKETATNLLLTNNRFISTGIINNSTDRDFFKLVLPRRMKVSAGITPNNVAANNAGANADMFLTLMNSKGDTIGRYNPGTLLNAAVDTTLAAGTYYFGADGTGNQNVSDYGSVGLYVLSGTLESVAAAPTILLKGNVRDHLNVINWQLEPGIKVRSEYVEYSLDGDNYTTLNSVPTDALMFSHVPPRAYEIFYRIRTVLDDESTVYSNVISLTTADHQKVSVRANLVTDVVAVNSDGDYVYQLIDAMGRLLGRGRINEGANNIPLNTAQTGVIVLKVSGKSGQFQFRLIKR